MRVTLTEFGGWTNLTASCTVDTEQLPETTAIQLVEAIDHGKLFDAPLPPPNPLLRGGRVVKIVAHLPAGRRSATFKVGNMPSAAMQVLRLLRPFLAVERDSR